MGGGVPHDGTVVGSCVHAADGRGGYGAVFPAKVRYGRSLALPSVDVNVMSSVVWLDVDHERNVVLSGGQRA